MNIKYWPSLVHIALVRIALCIIHTFDLQAIKNDFFTTSGRVSDEYYHKTESRVNVFQRKYPLFLPKDNDITGVVSSIALEIVKWFRHHNEIVVESDLDLWTIICWHSYGIIDRFATAKLLVQNENINTERRFVLACKYFFEDHARSLWGMFSIDEKLYLADRYGSFVSMKFWMVKLQDGDATNMMQMFHGSTGIKYFHKNYLGLRSYFKTLSPEARYMCFSYGLQEGEIYQFDLYLCFTEMSIAETEDLVRRLCPSTRLRILELLLYWPLQYIFLDTLCHLWKFISHYNFRNILNFIIEERIKKGWDDVDYLQLLVDIWDRCPIPYKNRIEKDKIYRELKTMFLDIT